MLAPFDFIKEKKLLRIFSRYCLTVKVFHGFDNWVDTTCDDFFYVVPGLFETMVSDTVLENIVRTYFLRTVSGSYLGLSICRVLAFSSSSFLASSLAMRMDIAISLFLS